MKKKINAKGSTQKMRTDTHTHNKKDKNAYTNTNNSQKQTATVTTKQTAKMLYFYVGYVQYGRTHKIYLFIVLHRIDLEC